MPPKRIDAVVQTSVQKISSKVNTPLCLIECILLPVHTVSSLRRVDVSRSVSRRLVRCNNASAPPTDNAFVFTSI